MNIDELDDWLLYTRVMRQLLRRIDRVLKPLRLNRELWDLMENLHRQPMSATEVAGIFGCRMGSVSRYVATLEMNGWLQRRSVPADRRAATLELTGEGASQLQRAREVVLALLSECKIVLAEPERELAKTLCSKLKVQAPVYVPDHRIIMRQG